MAVAGSLTYDTKIDKNGFKSGLNGIEKETNKAGSGKPLYQSKHYSGMGRI